MKRRAESDEAAEEGREIVCLLSSSDEDGSHTAAVGVPGLQQASQHSNGSLALSSQGSAGHQGQHQARKQQRRHQQRGPGQLSLVASSQLTNSNGDGQRNMLKLTSGRGATGPVTRNMRQQLATGRGATGALSLQHDRISAMSARPGDPMEKSITSSAGPRAPGRPSQISWAAEYAPKTREDLVIHKKKVEELYSWMEAARRRCGSAGAGCLLLTGPPGCGKSTLVRVLAQELGLRLSEWTPPAGSTWEEHLHVSDGMGAAPRYRSKLDEFEDFVGRSTMFPTLALRRSRAEDTKPPDAALKQKSDDQKIWRRELLLIDDLPHAAGPTQRARLASSLGRMASASRFPVAVITTTGDNSAAGERFTNAALGSHHGLHKELLTALEQSGVSVVSLNPVTANNAAKALQLIGAAMGVSLAAESAAGLAEASCGNLHNAIECLQLHMLGHVHLGATNSVRKVDLSLSMLTRKIHPLNLVASQQPKSKCQ